METRNEALTERFTVALVGSPPVRSRGVGSASSKPLCSTGVVVTVLAGDSCFASLGRSTVSEGAEGVILGSWAMRI